MQLSKLSKNTYHKCVKELHEAKYIYYHPSPSKFQAVRISIVRLDKEEEPKTRYHQLDLFSPPSKGDLGRRESSIKNDTGTVSNLRPSSTNYETGTVPNLGHNIKPNSKTERNLPTPDFLEEESGIQKKKTAPPHVSNSVHNKIPSTNEKEAPLRSKFATEGHEGATDGNIERSRNVPSFNEVETWFTNHSYPQSEATKFYNHYKSLGWKIQGKTPIEDWKPLVEKWMTNAKKWEGTTEPKSVGPQQKGTTNELQYLYDSFLEGNKIFHQITEDHFTKLNLVLDEEVMQQAWQQRINQLAGTNQYSLGQLWQAYLTNDVKNHLVQQDNPNLILLAKRIAVIKHFQQLKNKPHEH